MKIEARGGYPIGLWNQKWTKFRSWVLLWLLGCLRGVLGASWRRFGTVWSGSWVPTWVPTWSQLGQKIDPKIDHFWDASWDLFLDGFLWILGAQMEPSWHQNGIKNRCLLGRAIFQNSCSGCSAGGPQRVPHRTVRWGTPLGLDCKNGIQVGMHLGIDFSSILMVFGRQVGRQNGPKIDSKKHGKKQRAKHPFWKVLGGGAPSRGHPGAGSVRPPNYQLPNTTGTGQMGLGKGKYRGLG